MIFKIALIILLSYCFGSITGAYYVTKLMLGKDIRMLGSGNVGARNAGRQLGTKGFLYTLSIDTIKVIFPLLITDHFFPENKMMLLVSALFLLIGHIWPIQLGFKGGKGVVVYLVSTLYILPIAIVIVGISVGISYMLIQNFTIAGLIAMISIPITAWILGEYYYATGLLLLLIIVVILHIIRK